MWCMQYSKCISLLPLFAIRIFAPDISGLPFRWSKESTRSLFIGGGDMSSSSSSSGSRDFSLSLDRPLLALLSSVLLFGVDCSLLAGVITSGECDFETNFSRASASRWAACNARACCSTIARPISKLAWLTPTPKGDPPGGPGGPPGGRPAWLYILNSANRVISNADKGLEKFKPGGLLLPPWWSTNKNRNKDWKYSCIFQRKKRLIPCFARWYYCT